MNTYQILWADDEIDLLKPYVLFLEKKGYKVTTVNSGSDALDQFQETDYDLVFLDENMPGMTGLEVLSEIKVMNPNVPVVMITKSEEEYIMEEAIGAKIADYIIKPFNPSQLLISIKKILDKKRIVSEKTNSSYQQEFQKISMSFSDDMGAEEWANLYKKLIYWELEIEQTENKSMQEVLEMQKEEANTNFIKFIEENYVDWISGKAADAPLMSHDLMKKKVLPEIPKDERPVFFILIDNLRLDQWEVLEPIIAEYYTIEEESTYYSILPTTTAYARNAIFSGLMPDQIAKKYPQWWSGEDEEGGKNNYEEELLRELLKKVRFEVKMSYQKVITSQQGKNVLDNIHNLFQNNFNVIIYNFVDMLSHAKTDTRMIRELAVDEAAYRSLTHSWFLHSTLLETLKALAERDARVIITTDHGTIRTTKPHKIVGDRNTNTNLRFKLGKKLSYDDKYIFEALEPELFKLPKPNLSTTYVFATNDYFFAYPNNFNHYVNYYKDTFQHGGLSMEEMIIPYIKLNAK